MAQVGINTTSPNATLDIQTTNAAAPSATDGILIPKIDEFPATNPTAAQDGMMVFVTGNGSVSKGFYYWDQTATNWQTISGAMDHDWYQLPLDTPADTITDNLYTLGKITIGRRHSGNVQLEVYDTISSNLAAISALKRGTASSAAQFLSGIVTSVTDSISREKTGLYSYISGPVSTRKIGIRSIVVVDTLTPSLSSHFGFYNSLSGHTDNSSQTGILNLLGTSGNARDRTGTANVLYGDGSISDEVGTSNTINSSRGRQFGTQNLPISSDQEQHEVQNILTGDGNGW